MVRRGILFLGVLLLLGREQATATEYLLVERPSKLVVYDRYQQRARASEAKLLAPFAPMVILRANDVMGDGITPCMSVEAEGVLFYLLRDSDGRLSGESNAGVVRTITAAAALSDTVRVLRNRVLWLSNPSSSSRSSLEAGSALVRIFRVGTRTYVRRIAAPGQYGWVMLDPSGEGRHWSIVRSRAPAVTAIPQPLRDSIKAKVNAINAVLASLFQHFNRQTHLQRPVPYWRLDAIGDTLLCRLENVGNPADFAESSRYLAKDLENLVLGTSHRVLSMPARIAITLE